MKEPTKRLVTVLGIIAALIAGAPAFADLIFTSTPPTTATVGRPYSYTMMAANAPEDGGRHGPGERLRFVARALPVWLRFDGSDTIFGTPGPEDAGEYKVKLRAINKGTHVDQEFSIIVNAKSSSPGPPGAEGADLAAFVAVSPNPLTVGGTASWTATARNVANEDVANTVLETVFSGDAPFQIDSVDDESCAIELRGDDTAVTCRWSALEGGDSRSAEVTGRASGPGSITAVASVSIADASPVDSNSGNDFARIALSVTEAPGAEPSPTGNGPALTLNGESTITVTVGESYMDPGATAIDDVDGDLTSRISVDNPVDTNVIGRYSVTYEVVDSAGNVTTATRTVEVLPRSPVGGGGGGAADPALLLLLTSYVIFERLARRRPRRGS